MSCSSTNFNFSLTPTHDGSVSLPKEYYVMTLAMFSLVFMVPFLYRKIWLAGLEVLEIILQKDSTTSPPGCRRLGKPGDRNLSEEFTKEIAIGNSPGRVISLFDYPMKSGYPVEMEACTVTPSGLEHDRQFCFAKWVEPTAALDVSVQKGGTKYWKQRKHWEFLTQRTEPFLTHIKSEIWVPDWKTKGYSPDAEYVKSGGCLVISFSFAPPNTRPSSCWSNLAAKVKARNRMAIPHWSFRLPLNPTAEQIEKLGYSHERVRIWRDEPSALNVTKDIPKNILRHLKLCFKVKSELKLFRVDSAYERSLYKCAPTQEQLGYQAQVSFQDSYPISIQNMASILEIESHVLNIKDIQGYTADSRRFRGNIYIVGPPAFAEDDWTLIRIGNLTFHVSCRITRCSLPNRNPNTGELPKPAGQPLEWFNKNRAIDEGHKDSGCLGMMMVPTKDSVGGVVRVGDEVEVLKTGKHYFIADPEPEFQVPVL